jgi:hypothetical protein
MKKILLAIMMLFSISAMCQNTVDFEKLSGGGYTSSMTLNGGVHNYNLPVVTISTSTSVLSVRINDQVYNYVPAKDAITINGVLMTTQTSQQIADLLTTTVFQDGSGGSGGGTTNGVGRDTITTITSGTSSTIPNGTNVVLLNPSSITSAYSLTFPATPHTSNTLTIFFGGTITAGTVITTLTSIANSGQTLNTVNASGSGTFGESWVWKIFNNVWYRIN